MTVLLDLSLDPSVSGWYAVDIFSFIPVNLVSASQNRDTNSLSRSQTMSVGSPFSQYQLSKNTTASLCGYVNFSWDDSNVRAEAVSNCGKLFFASFVVSGVKIHVWSANFGKNTEMYRTSPRKPRTSEAFFGTGQFSTLSILEEFGSIPRCEI